MAWTPRRTVVLPQPFAPTIIVNGDSNSIACSRSGEKARMPRIANFSIWDMVASSTCARGSAWRSKSFSLRLAQRRRVVGWLRDSAKFPVREQRCDARPVKRVTSGVARHADQRSGSIWLVSIRR
jgi:hypothetical protein